MTTKRYCGIGSVPKGSKRGSAKYCIDINQVRYYGIEQISPSLILKVKKQSKKIDPLTEKIKLKSLQTDAKVLLNEVANLKLLLDLEKISATEKKAARKKLDTLLGKKEGLIKSLTNQKKIVEQIERDEKAAIKQQKTPASKSGSKTSRSSKSSGIGSKTSRSSRSSRSGSKTSRK